MKKMQDQESLIDQSTYRREKKPSRVVGEYDLPCTNHEA
jgi:hypothetical protein